MTQNYILNESQYLLGHAANNLGAGQAQTGRASVLNEIMPAGIPS